MKSPHHFRQVTLVATALTLIAAACLFWQHRTYRQEIEQLRKSLAQERVSSRSASSTDSDHRQTTRKPSPAGQDLSTILALPDPATRIRSLIAFADTVPVTKIAETIKQLRDSSPDWDPDARAAIHLLLTRWATEAPDQALASLQTLDPTKHGGDATSILSGIAATDPLRAAKWLEDPDNRMTAFPIIGHFLAGSITKEWVRSDPSAALAWAEKLPDNQRIGAYVALMGTLASSDPRTASSLVTKLEDGGPRREAIKNIATLWSKQAPEAAMAWVQTLTGEDRQSALTETLGGWASKQPQAAAAYLDQNPNPDLTAAQVKAVSQPWVNREPAAAAAWVASRPAGAASSEAMSDVMWRWTLTEPVAASTWLRAQPAGPSRDAGIAGLALATFDTDPSASLTWAASISDETKRAESLTKGLAEWMKRDAAAARDFAAKNGIQVP